MRSLLMRLAFAALALVAATGPGLAQHGKETARLTLGVVIQASHHGRDDRGGNGGHH